VSPDATNEKLVPVDATPVTASVNVTVHCTLAEFVGDACARRIETTFGAVASTVHEKLVAELLVVPETARTWKTWRPSASPLKVVELGRVVPQRPNDPPSSEHSKLVIGWLSVYVNDAERELERSGGDEVIVGAASVGAPKPTVAHTASAATSATTAKTLLTAPSSSKR
jgi:hypothetical protein